MTPKDMRKAGYTHSPWTGKAYDKPMTQADLLAESMAVLRRHPTISKYLAQRARIA